MKMEVLDRCGICAASDLEQVDPDNNLCRCRTCGFVFDNPRPTLEEIGHYYSQPSQYDSWLDRIEARDDLWRRRLAKLLPIHKPGSLLDIGAGIGQFLHHARPHFTTVAGTELSDSAIIIARDKYNLPLIKGDVLDIDFDNSTRFDNITIFHVLEHVPDPRATIKKCYRLLSDGGLLVVCVPNDLRSLKRNAKSSAKRFFRSVGINRWRDPGRLGLPRIALDGSMDEIHLSHFTSSVLHRLLTDNGFTVVQNSVDPYFVASGARLVLEKMYCAGMSATRIVLRRNWYETIWMAAYKNIDSD